MLNSSNKTGTKSRTPVIVSLLLSGCFANRTEKIRVQDSSKEPPSLNLKAAVSGPEYAPSTSESASLTAASTDSSTGTDGPTTTSTMPPRHSLSSASPGQTERLSLPAPYLELPDAVSAAQPFYCSLVFTERLYMHLPAAKRQALLSVLAAEIRIIKNGQQIEQTTLPFSQHVNEETRIQKKKLSQGSEANFVHRAQVTAVTGIDLGDEFECAAKIKVKSEALGSAFQNFKSNPFDALETAWVRSKKATVRSLVTIVPKEMISFIDTCQFKQEFALDLAPGVTMVPESIFIEASGKGVQNAELVPNGYTVTLDPQDLDRASSIQVKLEFQTMLQRSLEKSKLPKPQNETQTHGQFAESSIEKTLNSAEMPVLASHDIQTTFEIRRTDAFEVQPSAMLPVYNGTGIEPKDLTTCLHETKSRASLTVSENFICALTSENQIACVEKSSDGTSSSQSQSTGIQPQAKLTLLMWPHEDSPMHLKASAAYLCARGSEGSLACYKEDARKWSLLKIPPLDAQDAISSFDLHQEWLCFVHDPLGNSKLSCLSLSDNSPAIVEAPLKKQPDATQLVRIAVFKPQVCAITSMGQAICSELPKKSSAQVALQNRLRPEAKFDGSSPAKTAIDIGFLAGQPCFLNAQGDINCSTGKANAFLSAGTDPFIQMASGQAAICGLRKSGTALCQKADGSTDKTAKAPAVLDSDLRTLARANNEICALNTEGKILCYDELTNQKVFDSSTDLDLKKLGLSSFKVTKERYLVNRKDMAQEQ